jgi:hypothetical protein
MSKVVKATSGHPRKEAARTLVRSRHRVQVLRVAGVRAANYLIGRDQVQQWQWEHQ